MTTTVQVYGQPGTIYSTRGGDYTADPVTGAITAQTHDAGDLLASGCAFGLPLKTVGGAALIGQGNVPTTGASAYQVAVDQGFVGNEAAWLASLVGAAGPAGPAGPFAFTPVRKTASGAIAPSETVIIVEAPADSAPGITLDLSAAPADGQTHFFMGKSDPATCPWTVSGNGKLIFPNRRAIPNGTPSVAEASFTTGGNFGVDLFQTSQMTLTFCVADDVWYMTQWETGA